MIKRELKEKILELAKSYPVIALTGPRQSGKTTLVKELFLDGYRYVSLEDIDMRSYATSDPRGFLQEYNQKVIIDEAQHAPDLFSYIQGIVDEHDEPGQFIITGSQNFLLTEQISQSLAGRVAIFNLLPLSLKELKGANLLPKDIEELLFTGCYPRIYSKKMNPSDWYSNYIKTYIERDVRMIKNIHDLGTFQTFIKMCASRTGQLLDLTSIGNDCGVTHNTIKSWINILEASFLVFQLRPHHKNFNKRLMKSPKLYFYDTGLLCNLLGIESPEQLKTHYLRGGIFECFVISELIKGKINRNDTPHIYFWRDHHGHEVDCILESSRGLIPIEIKSSKTIASSFFNGLKYWDNLSDVKPENSYLVYAGETNQKRSAAHVVGWKQIDEIIL